MDVQSAYEQISDAFFLDVREDYEFEAGHIAGSTHIPLMHLPERISEIPTESTVIVVCQVGQRSDLAAKFLSDQGYTAHNLEGGLARWQAAGLPFQHFSGDGPQVVDGSARDFNGLIER